MEVTDEEFGGTMVTLGPGDSLKAVPRSHRRLVTPEIEAWWVDPVRAIREVAERAVSPNMSEWFRRMAEGGSWRLQFHKASYGVTQAGFWLSCPGIRGAEVGPPSTGLLPKKLPPALSAYYRLVSFVDWMGFGATGGLGGPEGHTSLSDFNVDLAHTFDFGSSPCGDKIIYTADGRGGWFNLGTQEIRILGSITDTIDWVYGELLADHCPDYFLVR